ncbi:MAG: type IV pili methyl-accepting chemotaxis transducer N-terminal domain-containing protein [Burkholderiaceae bacterium]
MKLSLSAKFGAIGAALLLMAFASISLTLWVTWQLEGGAAALNEGGRLRMQTWRLAQGLPAADVAEFQRRLANFDRSLELLRAGDPSRPLFVPSNAQAQQALGDIEGQWQVLRKSWSERPQPDLALVTSQAEAFAQQIDGFVSAIEHQLARWTALLNAFQFVMMALTVASTVTLLYASYLFIFNPLARLKAGLLQVGTGDLSVRVPPGADDEFGELSAGFNRMAGTLETLYHSLESRVVEKTVGLETERARLAALYEATAFVATATSLNSLAEGFARQVRLVARADASAVRWSDEANQSYVMLASDCLPQHVIDAEHCIPTGACFCGQAQGQAYTRVIPIRPLGQASMPGQCERAGFDTVISVPVRQHERMVGELNLFYRRPTELGDEDRTLLETLASHLAGAIEGLRAGALEREAAVADERGMLARELHDSIAQSLSFLKIQSSLLREHLKRDDAPQVDATLSELDVGIHESLADVRELLLHFRTRTNTEDITPALRTTLTKFEHQTGLKSHLVVEGQGRPPDPDVQVQVLHVVQEALSNVRKHARARQVWIEVHQGPQWRVEVRDDGRGFESDDGAGQTQVGLRIMRERAHSIGATVEVASVAGSGTCVVLTLPRRESLAVPA